MWVGKSESSSFWMGILTDLKACGVQDILITCLRIPSAPYFLYLPFKSVWYISSGTPVNIVYKDKKEFTEDMKYL